MSAALPPGFEALEAFVGEWVLGELPPAEERLPKLMLSLAEVGPAVEWFGDPMVYDGFNVHKIRYTRRAET